MPKICLDAGHGGSDPGALLSGRYEKTDTLKMVLRVKELLEKQGITVILTRDKDKYLSLSDRCKIANNNGADYFLSIHRNALNAKSTGVEIWIYSKATSATYNKAKGILDNIAKISGTINRGVKKGYTSNPNADYAINRESKMASALLELLFITNPDDNKQLDNNFEKYAEAIAKGLCSAVGVTYKYTSEVNKDKDLYLVQVLASSSKANAEKLAKELESLGYNTIIKKEKR